MLWLKCNWQCGWVFDALIPAVLYRGNAGVSTYCCGIYSCYVFGCQGNKYVIAVKDYITRESTLLSFKRSEIVKLVDAELPLEEGKNWKRQIVIGGWSKTENVNFYNYFI